MPLTPIRPREVTSAELITEIAMRFPTLRPFFHADTWAKGFAALDFARWAGHGDCEARLWAASFVLSVWTGVGEYGVDAWWEHEPYALPRFCFLNAWLTWDAQHKAAFRAWMEDPRLP